MQPNFQRQVTLLSLIPRAPRKISVNELVQRLANRTQDAGKRSVQRDLKAMYEMGTFGLRLDDRNKPYGWSIETCWRGLNVDLMDQHMALALSTLKRSASQLMPPQSLQQLQPYFERADKVLASDPDNPWLYWACRVAQLPEPYPFILPQHEPKSLAVIQQAILDKKQISCDIKKLISRKMHWLHYSHINPQGIIIRDSVVLLAFTIGSFDTRRHHKPIGLLRNAQLLTTHAIESPDFDINKAAQGTSGEKIRLELLLSDRATFIMREAKFSEAQEMRLQDDGRFHVSAEVCDTPKLRAALWEMADTVEVLAPAKLREHFVHMTHKMGAKYL
ncbi:MAG: helix-turn-helix transcriptional regulator [Shewanella sp.]